MMYCRHVSGYLTRLRKLPTKRPRCNGPVGRSPVKITRAAPQEVIAALMQSLSKIEKDEFWQMKTFYHRLCGRCFGWSCGRRGSVWVALEEKLKHDFLLHF